MQEYLSQENLILIQQYNNYVFLIYNEQQS